MKNTFGKKKNHFSSWAESANPTRSAACTWPASALHLCTAAKWAPVSVRPTYQCSFSLHRPTRHRDSPPNPLLARALVAGNSAAATPVRSALRPPAAAVLTRLRTCLGTSCPPRASKPSPHFAAPTHTLPLPLHHHDARDKPLDDRPAQCIATSRS
jgi:hypothetical protein